MADTTARETLIKSRPWVYGECEAGLSGCAWVQREDDPATWTHCSSLLAARSYANAKNLEEIEEAARG